jgi:hypothetical protein
MLLDAWAKKLATAGAFGRVELPLTAAGNTVDPDMGVG